MNKIYLIVENTEGPSGQGGESSQHISLMHDGDCFSRGNPYHAFKSFEAAESFRKTLDEYNYHHIIELAIYKPVDYSWSYKFRIDERW